MLISPVKDSKSLDRALKMLKNKVIRVGQVKEIRRRMEFVKPSVKKRADKLNAIYKNKKRLEEEDGV